METKKSKLEISTDIIKIIGYIAGGIWVIYLYLTHENELKKLEVSKGYLEIKMDSMSIVKSNQEYLKGQQDLEIKNLELKYAESLKKSELQTLLNQNESELIELRYKDFEKKINNQKNILDLYLTRLKSVGARMENQRDSIKLRYNTNRKFTSQLTLNVVKEPEGQQKDVYEIVVRFDLTNVSEVELELSMIAVEFFSSNFDRDKFNKSGQKFASAVTLPNIFNSVNMRAASVFAALPDSDETYTPKWEMVGYDCSLFAPSESVLLSHRNRRIVSYLTNKLYAIGGLCNGLYVPEESTYFQKHYYVKGKPDEMVGVVVNVVFNRGKNHEDFWYTGAYKELR